MSHYEELTPYQYWGAGQISEVVSIGWITKGKSFAKGNVPEEFLAKLETILISASKGEKGSHYIVNAVRGRFDCELCKASSNTLTTKDKKHKLSLGTAEILIPQLNNNGFYFSAPTLIHHYIVEHNYLPPKEFINSLINLEIKENFSAKSIFKELTESREWVYFY